jgi:ribosomal protein S27E
MRNLLGTIAFRPLKSGLRPDRRVGPRADLGACRSCKNIRTVYVHTRTESVLYARCAFCGRIWPVDKPRTDSARGAQKISAS